MYQRYKQFDKCKSHAILKLEVKMNNNDITNPSPKVKRLKMDGVKLFTRLSGALAILLFLLGAAVIYTYVDSNEVNMAQTLDS